MEDRTTGGLDLLPRRRGAAAAPAAGCDAAAVGGGIGRRRTWEASARAQRGRSRRGEAPERASFLPQAASATAGDQRRQQERLLHACPCQLNRLLDRMQRRQARSERPCQPLIIESRSIPRDPAWSPGRPRPTLRNRVNRPRGSGSRRLHRATRCRASRRRSNSRSVTTPGASSSVGISPGSISSSWRHSTTCDHCRRHSTKRGCRRTTSSKVCASTVSLRCGMRPARQVVDDARARRAASRRSRRRRSTARGSRRAAVGEACAAPHRRSHRDRRTRVVHRDVVHGARPGRRPCSSHRRAASPPAPIASSSAARLAPSQRPRAADSATPVGQAAQQLRVAPRRPRYDSPLQVHMTRVIQHARARGRAHAA